MSAGTDRRPVLLISTLSISIPLLVVSRSRCQARTATC